nr:aspartate/glutamate racemase family protein [Propionibacterium freudenreichii]
MRPRTRVTPEQSSCLIPTSQTGRPQSSITTIFHCARLVRTSGSSSPGVATLIAVPCNTVHYFINQFIDEVPVPFVNIVDATLDAAQKASPEGAWLTCTRGTVETGLYQREAEKRHYTILTPDDDGLDQLMTIVGEVKAGRLSDAGIHYSEIAEQLMSMHELPLMTACTELPLAFEASGLSPSIQISSLTALAEASMSEINKLEPALS